MSGGSAEMHHLVDQDRSMRAAEQAAGLHHAADDDEPLDRDKALKKLAELRRKLGPL